MLRGLLLLGQGEHGGRGGRLEEGGVDGGLLQGGEVEHLKQRCR